MRRKTALGDGRRRLPSGVETAGERRNRRVATGYLFGSPSFLLPRMRVAFLINDLGTGGAQSLIVTIAESTEWPDGPPVVCYFGGSDEHAAAFEAAGLEVVCFGARTATPQFDPRAVARMWRYFRENEFDVIHAHLPYAASLARLVGRRTGTPVVTTQHSLPRNYHPVERFAERRTRGLDAVTTFVSRAVESEFLGEGGFGGDTQVIYNGIDAAAFDARVADADREAVRARYGIGPDDVVFLNIGRCIDVKRQTDLVRAMAHLQERASNAHLLVVGGGDLQGEIEREVAEHGLEACVSVVGQVPKREVGDFYAAADVYVISSLFEGMPITLLEAMAASLPVVATDVPGVAEFVDPDVTGLLVPVKSPSNLAAAMDELLDDERRNVLGANGRAVLDEQYDIGRTTAAYRALYEQVAARAADAPTGRVVA